MWPIIDRRPTLDRDSPRRTNGNAVANPRIRACSPTSSRPALSSARSIFLTNFTLERVEKGYPVRIVLDLGHQSSLPDPKHALRRQASRCFAGVAQRINVWNWPEAVDGRWAEHVRSALTIQTSTCSAIASASSTSMPRYRTVLSNLLPARAWRRTFVLDRTRAGAP